MGMCVRDNVHLLHNLPSYCKPSIVKSAGNAVFTILSLSLLETATSFNSSTRLFTSRVLGIVKESSYILRLLLPSELSPQRISYRELIMSSLLTPSPLTSAGPDSQLGCGLPTKPDQLHTTSSHQVCSLQQICGLSIHTLLH